MIELRDLQKTYNGGAPHEHHALQGINLCIHDGDVFGIIGQSGAGKSTLVRCINLLERPTQGSVVIDGVDVTHLKGHKLLSLRASMGMIFQSFSLFQQRTVLGNVTFPLELLGIKKKVRDARARQLLDIVELSDKENCYPAQLSGGQKQRVAIARALANNPKVMLADEATSALDTRTTVSILKLLKDINRELGVTLVLITHSLAVAEKICNRIAVIDRGQVVEQGSAQAVFNSPQSSVTLELIENDRLAFDTQEQRVVSLQDVVGRERPQHSFNLSNRNSYISTLHTTTEAGR